MTSEAPAYFSRDRKIWLAGHGKEIGAFVRQLIVNWQKQHALKRMPRVVGVGTRQRPDFATTRDLFDDDAQFSLENLATALASQAARDSETPLFLVVSMPGKHFNARTLHSQTFCNLLFSSRNAYITFVVHTDHETWTVSPHLVHDCDFAASNIIQVHRQRLNFPFVDQVTGSPIGKLLAKEPWPQTLFAVQRRGAHCHVCDMEWVKLCEVVPWLATLN